jgi:hypothetical protein
MIQEPIAVTEEASAAEPVPPVPREAVTLQAPPVKPLPEAVAFQPAVVETVQTVETVETIPLSVPPVEPGIVAETAPLSVIPAPVALPEGMIMVETAPGRAQVATFEAEPVSGPRRTPRQRPAEHPQEEETLVQIETRK